MEKKQRFHMKEGSMGVLQEAVDLQTKEAGGFRGRIQAESDDWVSVAN